MGCAGVRFGVALPACKQCHSLAFELISLGYVSNEAIDRSHRHQTVESDLFCWTSPALRHALASVATSSRQSLEKQLAQPEDDRLEAYPT